MMKIMLTSELAYASGRDAGNTSMRRAGRKRWNVDDYNIAAETTNRLLASMVPVISNKKVLQGD